MHKEKQRRFDIVMLDLGVPDRDGHALMQDFKARKARQHTVLVTADDSLESIQKAIAAGANGYVVKPYSEEKILDVISNYIVRQRPAHRYSLTRSVFYRTSDRFGARPGPGFELHH